MRCQCIFIFIIHITGHIAMTIIVTINVIVTLTMIIIVIIDIILKLLPFPPVKESPCNVERSHPCSDGCTGQTRNVSVFICIHHYDFQKPAAVDFIFFNSNLFQYFRSLNWKYLLLCDWWQHILQVWPVGCPKVHLDHLYNYHLIITIRFQSPKVHLDHRHDDHDYHHIH